jgi:hypothetical protein
MDELKKKILADIQQTGFAAELVIGSKFIKREWIVTHGASYLDIDTGKSRELDIIAIKSKSDKSTDFHLVFHLNIQVKSSKRPWVIFSSPSGKTNVGWLISHAIFNFLPNEHLPYPQIGQGLMRTGRIRIGTAFHEAFKSPQESSQIYEAVVSACKATLSQKLEFEGEFESESEEDKEKFYPNGMKFLRVFVPLVVIDGQLFEAFLDDNGDLQLDGQDYIPVDFGYATNSSVDIRRNKSRPEVERFFPDVVTISGLDSYLTLVEKWQNAIYQKATTNISKHLEQLAKPSRRRSTSAKTA